MNPEEALAAARQLSAEHADIQLPAGGMVVKRSSEPSSQQLIEWAIMEPNEGEVRSTRKLGQPITLAKRLLLRLLGQYHAQLLAIQNRFNVHMAMRATLTSDAVNSLQEELVELRSRVEMLESQAGAKQASSDESTS